MRLSEFDLSPEKDYISIKGYWWNKDESKYPNNSSLTNQIQFSIIRNGIWHNPNFHGELLKFIKLDDENIYWHQLGYGCQKLDAFDYANYDFTSEVEVNKICAVIPFQKKNLKFLGRKKFDYSHSRGTVQGSFHHTYCCRPIDRKSHGLQIPGFDYCAN
jgi:hypothetical protein